MIIKTFKGGYDNNCSYLAIDSDQALLIDPSVPAQKILNYCKDNNLKLTAVVLMHSHHDHLVDLDFYRRLGYPLLGHKSLKLDVSQTIDETDTVPVGRKQFTVMHTPGHCFASLCLYDGKHLFTSDTIFVHGIGRVDFPTSEPKLMAETISRIKRLPDSTIIYPGHDYGPRPTSTIGDEKRMNPYFKMKQDEVVRLA